MSDKKQSIQVDQREILIGDSMIFIGKPDKKKEWIGKEVIMLTYLFFGKPHSYFILVEDAKKIERFTPYCSKEKISELRGKTMVLTTGIALL